MFNNECLGHLEYEAVAPAIAMASLMIIFAIDFLAARWLAKRSALHAHKEPHSPSTLDEKNHFGHDHDFSGIDEGVLAGRDTARARWEVKLLEAGICFHSVMIGKCDWRSLEFLRTRLTFPGSGVTLGAQGGDGFVSFQIPNLWVFMLTHTSSQIPTFCAIIFHQLFEGLGLGARIGRLKYPNGGSWQKWLMCIVYTLITPVGIAIVRLHLKVCASNCS